MEFEERHIVAINYAYLRHPRMLTANDYGFFLVAVFKAAQMASDETSCK